ncbi:amidohydrolase family protein [Streptomyces rishiriensis]|uniref:amidohydrolase family protein n=1 Tax=Streptomyces rishiriensis TaxID=68264 RepID=UPI0027D865FC|nr:amidohydrolase family protein [Streptomyces rishiriensis]
MSESLGAADGVSGDGTPFAPPGAGELVVYPGLTLFDGTGSAPRPGASLVVDGSVIRSVADETDVAAALAEGAEVVDLTGHFVTPGLVDAHQHLATPPDRAAAEAVLRRLVHSGVTAVRDMADDLRQVGDLARAALVGEIAAPDIHYAALMAGPGFFDDPRTHQVTRGAVPGHVPWMQAVGDTTDLPLAVALARGTYASAIKVYADLEADLVAAITAEAHRQGIAVWAHAAVFPATPGEVVAAGVDSVSHVTLLAHEAAEEPLTSYKDKPAVDHESLVTGEDARLDALFARMRERDVVLDATAGMWASEELAGDDPESTERARRQTELAIALTAQAHRAGVALATGTDYETAPGEPFPALYEELAFLVKRCGIPAPDVLRSATLVGARSAGTAHLTGSVEPGKLADFAVFAQDPLADIDHLRTITLTVKRGRRFPRAAYAATPSRENR